MAASRVPRVVETTDLEWGVARGIAGFRWLALGWASTVFVLTRAQVVRPGLGVVLPIAALAFTSLATEASIRRRRELFHPAAVVVELVIGAVLLGSDGFVYGRDHRDDGIGMAVGRRADGRGRRRPDRWCGGRRRPRVGRWLGSAWSPLDPVSSMALVSSGVLFAIAGAAAGAVMNRVRYAETEVAQARARDEVARTLHDGVLQTLAVVQRRSTDHELAALARDQELELRAFLAGDRASPALDLGGAIRAAAGRVERHHGLRVDVLFVDEDHPAVPPEVVDAVAGAVGEALTNAAKHVDAHRATVFVDVDDGVFASVKDDGNGFDPAAAAPGLGTSGSIHGRLATIGGTAEIDARPGSGVEVRLTAPLRSKRTTTS